jgi:alpha-ketoglutarate-dependent taurine dioxygenase
MEFVSAAGSFACEVNGSALWETQASGDALKIREAFQEHGVLVFRRQSLSERELLEFGRMIGSPSIYAETHWLSTYDEVIILSNMRGQDGEPLGGLANKGLTWHTDQSYYAEPVTGCFLYGVELPANGGNTRWASLYRAYSTLSNNMKNTIDSLVGTFSYQARAGEVVKTDDNHDRARRVRETPDVKHPLVNVNPATGRKALYIDPGTLIGIDGMPQDEADSLLDELLVHTVQPDNVYEHDWQVGDLVLWDNAVVLHARDAFPNEENRLVKRMIIKLDQTQYIIPPAVE